MISPIALPLSADRGNAIGDIKEKILADFEEVDDLEKGRVLTAFKNTEKNIVRENILSNQPRIDGRDLDTVRPLAKGLTVSKSRPSILG